MKAQELKLREQNEELARAKNEKRRAENEKVLMELKSRGLEHQVLQNEIAKLELGNVRQLFEDVLA